jgi:hypothetical protein
MLATGMFETFFTYLKISTVASVALGFPWILWQLWKFVAPGLYRHERRFVTMLLPMSLMLTILSSLFLYFFVLPVMLHFFVHFGTTVSPTQASIAEPPAGVAPLNIPVLAADPPTPKPGDVWFNSDLKELRLALTNPKAAADAAVKTIVYSTPLSTSSGILLQPKIREWVDTLLGLALAFAAGFQLPVVVLLLDRRGHPAFPHQVPPARTVHHRRHRRPDHAARSHQHADHDGPALRPLRVQHLDAPPLPRQPRRWRHRRQRARRRTQRRLIPPQPHRFPAKRPPAA